MTDDMVRKMSDMAEAQNELQSRVLVLTRTLAVVVVGLSLLVMGWIAFLARLLEGGSAP